MDSYEQRKALFEQDFSSGFLADFVPHLSQVYPDTWDESVDLDIGEHTAYVRRHLRRARAEQHFLNDASRNGLITRVVYNRSQDAHALAVSGRFATTLSKVELPSTPPRRARFRALYSVFEKLAQLPLAFPPDFLAKAADQTVPVNLDEPPIYFVIIHGPDDTKGDGERTLGFVYAKFLARGGRSYLGKGIDLLAMYGTGESTSEEVVVAEPIPTLRPDEQPSIQQITG